MTIAVSPPSSATEPLVSGEAVEVDVRVARLGSRALALTIDIGVELVLFVILYLVSSVALRASSASDSALLETVDRCLRIVVLLAYPTVIETVTNGRSLGKLAMGLRVVREDGGPIWLRHAFTRTMVGFTVEWPGLLLLPLTWAVGLTTMVFSPRGRRLGDLAAGTIVIHERVPAAWGYVQPMPAPLAVWATRLDLAAVSDDLALSVRHFLARAPRFREEHRARLAASLAGEVARKVTPPPPPGTPAWAYLAAVLAERHRRSLIRKAQTGPALRTVVPASTGWFPIGVAPGTGGAGPHLGSGAFRPLGQALEDGTATRADSAWQEESGRVDRVPGLTFITM